jgi:ubiquinone/menaquinone biosynthesis C-methylase UbiE
MGQNFPLLFTVLYRSVAMSFQVKDIQSILACWSQRDLRERVPQIAHRMRLVEMWAPEVGSRVLEVGCGQGDTTTVLATAVGESGYVLAVDKASPQYGSPPLGEAHNLIATSPLAKRIEFRLSTDLFDPVVDFQENSFDLVIFSHCSWYLSRPEELLSLFKRVRPWAQRLGYAEWDISPQNYMQIPHMLAVLIQAHIQSLHSQVLETNIHSLILPQDAKRMVQDAGWKIVDEQRIDTSTLLWDGKVSEISNALRLSESFLQDCAEKTLDSTRQLVETERKLLADIAKTSQMMSLSTYAFLAR